MSKSAIIGTSPGSEVIVYEVDTIELLVVVSGILATVGLVVILHSSIKSQTLSVPGTVQLNFAV
jgi:hypothetical protein